jgi:hypothetical protein
MTGIIFGYAAAVVLLIFAIGGIWEYFFVKKGSRRRIITLIVLLVSSVVVLVNQYLTTKQHDTDVGQISGLTVAIQKANETQQANAKEFTAEQEAARKEFLRQFNDLSAKVAKLQTEAATDALRKQAQNLQNELAATEKLLAPGPKVNFVFSLAGADKKDSKPVLRTALPAANSTVHVTAEILNPTETTAESGYFALFVCKTCKFAKDPEEFKQPPNTTDVTQRNRDWPFFYPKTVVSVAFDVIVPEGALNFVVGLQYRCKNCVSQDVQLLTSDLIRG